MDRFAGQWSGGWTRLKYDVPELLWLPQLLWFDGAQIESETLIFLTVRFTFLKSNWF